MAKIALTFALYQGEQLIRRDTIAQDIVKVGKDPRSHLRVDDELASRMHAVIEVSPTDITLIDLGNEPGTMVNGQRVNKCKIRPGDQLQIGSTTIVLESAENVGLGAPAVPATPAPAQVAPVVSAAVVDAPATPGAGFSPASEPTRVAPPSPAAIAAISQPPPPPAANPFGANPFQASANPFANVPPPPPAPANPFAANPFAGSARDVAPAVPMAEPLVGGGGYSLIKQGPDVSSDEVEVAHLSAVEVMIMWDANVLHVAHLTPPRSFYVGEETGDPGKKGGIGCDYFIPSETLGTTRAPVVVAQGGSASLVILPRATGWVDVPGQGKVTLADLISSGRARPSAELSGAHEFALPAGAKARMELEGGLAFQISSTNAGKHLPTGFAVWTEAAVLMFIGLSAMLHIGLVAVFAFFMPHMGDDDSEAIDRDQLLMMQKLLNAAAEREQEERETEQAAQDNADNKEGGTGERAKGEEGSMGNPNTRDTNKRYAVQKRDDSDQHLARQAALQEAAQFGMIGLIATMGGGDPNAPTAPWGREDSNGPDDRSARGNMFGDVIGDAYGAGGLGLSGIGEGGGGRGEGIGLGNFGGLGHGAGTGTGQGIGSGRGRLGGGHAVKAPKIREGATSVNGRLPPEVIQRIVRQNFGRFRLCYENGLRTNPNLVGRVAVKFIIDRNGAVSTTADGGSDLPDQGVVQCVVRGFGNLSFPQPEGGIVTVIYPIMFNPGE